MIYFIDFDGTICPNTGNPPSAHCLKVLKRLVECNNEIVIYSCRSNPDCVNDAKQSTHDMVQYLNQYKVPYHRVQWGKPFFNYYIDDRNIGVPKDASDSVDWEQIEKLLIKEQHFIYNH